MDAGVLANLRADVAEALSRQIPERGPEGRAGTRGPKGDKGDKGDRGPKGEPGEDGTVWRVVFRFPTDDIGEEGDFCLRDTGMVYQKRQGHYEELFSLRGPQGLPGASGWLGGGGGTSISAGFRSWKPRSWE